jgi:hypothetical protein
MQATGMNAIVAEYPGYGPNYSNERASVQTVQSYVQELCRELEGRGIRGQDITVIGRSIGSGPACLAGILLVPRALVLISPFCSLRAMVDSYAKVPYFNIPLMKHVAIPDFHNEHMLRDIPSPKLIIHG